MRTRLMVSVLAFLFVGCTASVGLVKPAPEVRLFDETQDKPLQVVIDTNIKSEMTVSSTGLIDIDFTEYRASLQNALQAAFSRSFSHLTFVDSRPAQGIVLHLESARPKQVKRGSYSTHSTNKAGGIDSQTHHEVGLKIKYRATLWKDGTKLATVDQDAESEDSAGNMYIRVGQVLKNGLEIMSEEMAKGLFTDATLATLAN